MADGSPKPAGTPHDRLRLVQWLSPAFPIGAFAYSQGLETVIATGAVSTPAQVGTWVADVLLHGAARLEAVLLAHARQDGADPEMLADLALAYAVSAERHLEMTEQGRAFGQAIAALTGEDQPPLPYAVALGHATRSLALPTEEVLELWLMGLANQILQAAVRFLPMGQTEAQAVLSRLLPAITTLAAEAATTPLGAIGATTPGADLAQMRHETLPTRIFRT